MDSSERVIVPLYHPIKSNFSRILLSLVFLTLWAIAGLTFFYLRRDGDFSGTDEVIFISVSLLFLFPSLLIFKSILLKSEADKYRAGEVIFYSDKVKILKKRLKLGIKKT